jgi:hypothetical protein
MLHSSKLLQSILIKLSCSLIWSIYNLGKAVYSGSQKMALPSDAQLEAFQAAKDNAMGMLTASKLHI